MNRRHLTMTGLMIGVALFAAGEVNAQARGPSVFRQQSVDPADSAATREAKIAELGAWLKRLVGRFHYEGTLDIADSPSSERRARGVGDCIGIGDGPGVHCVINVTWPEMKWPAGRDGVRPLAPAMILYGIDPESLGIRVLQVDGRSIAVSALSVLKGDTLAFTTPCINEARIPACRRITRIYIPSSSDGNYIRMSLDIEWWTGRGYERAGGYVFFLQRVPLS